MNKFTLFPLLAFISLPLLALPEPNFPTPQAIEGNVRLWANVYGVWGKYEVAIFDREDPGIVYSVVALPQGEGMATSLRNEKLARAAVASVKEALKKFDDEAPRSERDLAGIERAVYQALVHLKGTNKYKRWDNVGMIPGLKERFAEGYKLSGAHSAHIEQRLAANNLPKELLGIIFVESLFFNRACSRAGACGLWQLLRGTAKENIFVNQLVDERFDPVLATEAAIDYLKGAYEKFSSWPLAITSYNYGRAGVQRAINSGDISNYSDLYTNYQGKRFGFAAKNYYAEFLAALQIYQNAHQLFPLVNKADPWDYEIFTLPHATFFNSLEEIKEMSGNLAQYNPALTASTRSGKEVLPNGFKLRIPAGSKAAVAHHLQKTPLGIRRKAEEIVRARHRANGRQSLFQIARQHDISHEYLQQLGYQSRPKKGTVVVLKSAGSNFSILPSL